MISVTRDWDTVPRSLLDRSLDNQDGAPLTRQMRDELLEALRVSYANKCAFCESPIGSSQPLLHHYRPTALYPWLSLEWSNLLPCCTECNDRLGNRFPVEGTRADQPPDRRIQMRPDAAQFLEEQPLLLHPDLDCPEAHLSVARDGQIQPRNSSERGKSTIELCGLNRDDLVFQRELLFEAYVGLLTNTIPLDRMTDDMDSDEEVMDVVKTLFKERRTDGEDESAMLANPADWVRQYIAQELHWLCREREPYALVARSIVRDFESLFIEPEADATARHNLEHIARLVRQPPNALIPDIASARPVDRGSPLPVAVEQVRVVDFHGIRDAHVRAIPCNARWVFLTGQNGFGKTSILRAIAVGLIGPTDQERILADPSSRISLQFRSQGRAHLNHVEGDRFSRGSFFPQRKFAGYGPSRLRRQGRESQNAVNETSSATYSLFKDDGFLLSIEMWLHDFSFKAPERFTQLKGKLLELMPYLADIRVDSNPHDYSGRILYIERDPETGDTFDPVPFEHLASGNKSTLAMIGDMWIRLSRAHRNELDPAYLSGIVLIDELDNHLHPIWQRKLPGLLSRVFPRVQFIASTHSVIPCLGAPPDSVFLKVTRTQDAGTVVERLDIDVANLLPNSLLSSPLFDLDDLIPEANRWPDPAALSML